MTLIKKISSISRNGDISALLTLILKAFAKNISPQSGSLLKPKGNAFGKKAYNIRLPFQGVSLNRHSIPRLRHRAELTWVFSLQKN